MFLVCNLPGFTLIGLIIIVTLTATVAWCQELKNSTLLPECYDDSMFLHAPYNSKGPPRNKNFARIFLVSGRYISDPVKFVIVLF